MTKEQQGKLRELHTAQMTVAEIAETMKMKKSDVRRGLVGMGYLPIETKQPAESEFLKGQHIEIPKRTYQRITADVEKKICELREQCYTAEQIRIKLNLHDASTVRNVLKRNGYPTERGKYHKENKPMKLTQISEKSETKEDKPMTLKDVFDDIDKNFGELDEAIDEMIPEERKEPAPAATDTSSETIVPIIKDTTEKPKSQALSGIKMMMELEAMLDEVFGRDVQLTSVYAKAETTEIGFAYGGGEYLITFGQKGVPEYRGDAQ